MLSADLLTDALRAELADRATSRGFTLNHLLASGVANPDSSIGAYAPDAESYAVFAPLLDAITRAHHGLPRLPAAQARGPLFTRPGGHLGDRVISTRVRVARNLDGFAFPAGLSAAERLEVERRLTSALATLPPDLAGTYHPLGALSEMERDALVDDHLLFKSGDRFLAAAGITRDWPDGRGIFLSGDRRLVAWVNEEDHLRLISMQEGGDLAAVAERLGRAHAHLASTLGFAWDPRRGYLASCPSNLGTGMRASVHLRLDDPDPAAAKALGLQLRGAAGEHSDAVGGVYDVSNAHRLGLDGDAILSTLRDGVAAL